MKVGFITGITGQDGSYLAELLLEKGYAVHGIIRRSSTYNNTSRIDHLLKQPFLHLHYGDLTDGAGLSVCLAKIRSRYGETLERLEIYNLGAQSHVKVSFEIPEYTSETSGIGTLKLLEAIRSNNLESIVRFYQASTSELYGLVQEVPQSETTPFYPRSPYGVAKLYSFWITKNYREAYGMFACNGILYNHESPRRGHSFVTRKITIGLGKILRGEADRLVMGNLDSLRDWGYAKDFVQGMWRMLQQDQPDDYVLSTGEMHSVREFIEKAFALRDFHIRWKGEGLEEIGYDEITGRELIFIDPKYFRPAEVEQLLGNSTKARTSLGWCHDTTFDQLVKMMVDHDCG